jgi:transglutaminase-like putative cysteine protease
MFVRVIGLFFLTGLCFVTAVASSDEAPSWLQQAAAIKVPVYDKDVPAVVLQNDQVVTVSEDGRVTTTTTYAVRILTREGRDYAGAVEPYLTNSGKVRELHAWLIRPNGVGKKYDKDDIVDRISDPNDIYDEYRVKLIDGSRDADAGAVFGYQSISEERPLFSQDTWAFQNRLPTLISRYSLALPSGWRATSVTFNHSQLEPAVNGSTYTWEMRDLAPIRPEPASPKVGNVVARLAVNYFMADSGSSGAARTFETWGQVSRWATELHDPQAVPDATVTAKARELTANSKTELDRIRAIGQFVQRLQYISIDIGIGRGNGYRPHAAQQVLAKAYGDCKDKANLMRAMLKSVNITAYPIVIFLGDASHVREEWASPRQFNHCIIAVKVSDETESPTIIQHPTLGRLLIFDATDEHTTLGDLPDDEQGSLALIVAGESGTLTRMPALPPQSSQMDRQADVVLSPEGDITATIKERSTGQTAVTERRLFRQLSAPDYKQAIVEWLARGTTTAKVLRVQPVDDNVDGKFGLDVDFSAQAYAQLMQGRLLVFKPAIVSRRESLFLTEATRKQPIVLESHSFTETVHVKLPAGFQVDEMPDVVKLDTVFGSYTTSYEVKEGELVFVRSLAQKAATIPAGQYQSVRSFFEKIRSAEQAPVVLLKK